METLKVGELKNKFSHVLQRVQAGEEQVSSLRSQLEKWNVGIVASGS